MGLRTMCLTVLQLSLAACAAAGEPARDGRAGERELIGDPGFRQGFKVLAAPPGKLVPEGVLVPPEAPGEPVWQLAQWSSRFSIAGTAPETVEGGGCAFRNAGKTILCAPAGHADADLVLGVFGSVEYDGRARRKGEPWPHLLVSQRFADPPPVADLAAVPFHIEARLRHSEETETPDRSPSLHAAQFLMFVTIQNLNRESAGYGDFLYFGIPLYDSRFRSPRRFTAPDWQHKYIFTPDAAVYTDRSLHDGEWVVIDRDLLPLILEGLDTAWKADFLKDSRDLRDYRISGMNLGWEIPGIFDAEAQVRGLSLRAASR